MCAAHADPIERCLYAVLLAWPVAAHIVEGAVADDFPIAGGPVFFVPQVDAAGDGARVGEVADEHRSLGLIPVQSTEHVFELRVHAGADEREPCDVPDLPAAMPGEFFHEAVEALCAEFTWPDFAL